ncbi:manno-octulosonate cytidylyltransferase [Novosphingobium sp.]|uniref:3-deoxy-manno-octulosonate cytidylyltransferase n=1 Tax=Novosphingobium sp. TaxID=1874826 RepID=UPI0033417EFD
MTTTPGGVIIVIPARYHSTRFPAKPLALLRGAQGTLRPLIERTWRAASAVPGIDRVVVATDDARIADVAQGFGAEVAMTPADCRNGSERCAAVLAMLGDDPRLVINWQGDAPLTPAAMVTTLIERIDASPDIGVMTPAVPCTPAVLAALIADQDAGRVGGTTVVFNQALRALYFSKRVIPYVPPALLSAEAPQVHLHIGVYAYRPRALRMYAAAAPSPLEDLEGLEQLRFADIGVGVGVALCRPPGCDLIECNNPGDVAQIERALATLGVD